MGWSFETRDRSRESFIESLTSQRHFSPEYTPIAHRVVGNNVWQVVRGPDGKAFIHLDLISRHGGSWGYKGISEHMGPCEVNCPLSLIKLCDEPVGEWATNWRAKVAAYHDQKKATPKPTAGLVVKFGQHTYTLLSPLAPRKGWRVVNTQGQEFRMPSTHLKQALQETFA